MSQPFIADQLTVERRVVLQLREGCGLKDSRNNKMHAAFDIFNVARTVASYCAPSFELKGELLKSFEEYVSKGKVLSMADRYALSRVTSIGDHFLLGCSGLKPIDLSPLSNVTRIGDFFLYGCWVLNTIDLSPLSKVKTVGKYFLSGCSDTVQAQGRKFLGELSK